MLAGWVAAESAKNSGLSSRSINVCSREPAYRPALREKAVPRGSRTAFIFKYRQSDLAKRKARRSGLSCIAFGVIKTAGDRGDRGDREAV